MEIQQLIEKGLSLQKHIEDNLEKIEDPKQRKKAEQFKLFIDCGLYKLGYRKQKQKVNTTPPKNAFKKAEVKFANGIDNSSAPKNAFQRIELGETEIKVIENDAPKNAFKKQDAPKLEKVDKSGAKKSRLSKADKTEVTKLAKEDGFSVEEISEHLWFSEKAIRKHLGLKEPKKPKVLLGDNLGNDIDDFKQQVKDSKE